jgi:hypothetical protein
LFTTTGIQGIIMKETFIQTIIFFMTHPLKSKSISEIYL